MDKQEAVTFLFKIAQELMRSFEHPVILFTMHDYADNVFNCLVDMRTTLIQHPAPERVVDIINTFHYNWLEAVDEIEKFKKRLKDIPRELVIKAVEYTKECITNRHKYFQRYVEKFQSTMSAEEHNLMLLDIETLTEMRDSLIAVLGDKHKCFRDHADQSEYYYRILDEIEELFNWVDRLYDNLVIQLSKVVGLKFPNLLCDLTKTLADIIEDVSASTDPETQRIVKEIESKGRKLSSMVRLIHTEDLEIRKIIEKIKNLENRIERLKNENSSAVMALQHKTIYLEERLRSLENLKMSLYSLKSMKKEQSAGDLSQVECRIFNHLLPPSDRIRLVEEMLGLWNDAICGPPDTKSIISILSVADIKEVFSDDLGKFTVDKYGRKLYKRAHDDNLYQLNERNQLVLVKDDERHVYFYDDCGRYYLNEKKQRIYKAHENASEYMINRAGMLLKFKEIENGTEYQYDWLGRYYLDENGKRIYRDKDASDEYENDGLGNLVRIRSQETLYHICPPEPMVTAESNYLKNNVGDALKKCIAEVVLTQPEDPILYLANSLIKYRKNIEDRQNRLADEVEMMAERAARMVEELEPVPSQTLAEEEELSDSDTNFVNYATMTPETI